MNMRVLSILCFVALLCVSHAIQSQEKDDLGTEVVNVVKPYTPSISDAFKVKEMPILNDSLQTTKKKVEYGIFSVPVASTFTPSKGKAATVEKAKPLTLYDNYASLGFGNYTSILAELYTNFQISRTDNFGIFLKHHSSQGGIKDVLLDDKFYATRIDANYTSRPKGASYRLDAGIEHQLYNWYGLNESYDLATSEFIKAIDPAQTYFSAYLGGSISFEDSFFEKTSVQLRYLGDAFSSSEINFKAKPEFTFPLNEIHLKVDGDINYVSGSFDRDYFNLEDISYTFLNLGVLPSLVYVNEDLTLSLGAAAYFSVDSENSEFEFSIYPKINASYRLVDELLVVYGGADGGLTQNTYYSFKEENPYVSPNLRITPTNQLYKAFGGLKGKLSSSVGYNVRASYGKEENKALFVLQPYKGQLMDAEGYEQGNSFGLTYDDVTTLSVFGELKVEVDENFSLGASVTFNSYDNTGENETWNLPALQASVFSDFNIIKKIYGGASLFYQGERKDLFFARSPFANTVPVEVTLNSYVDANVHFGYRFSERLNFFLKGSNLLSDSYQKWLNYPVQGIQGLLGATYKFDW